MIDIVDFCVTNLQVLPFHEKLSKWGLFGQIIAAAFSKKLNKLFAVFCRYEPAPDERPISREMIDTIVRVPENTVDEVTSSEGREVRLEEDFVLQLPFLLPEDGYSCDIVRGVPGGLADFLAPLQRVGLCVMTPQPSSSGFWTIYMDVAGMGGGAGSGSTPTPSVDSSVMGPGPEPEVQTIKLVKSTSGRTEFNLLSMTIVGNF